MNPSPSPTQQTFNAFFSLATRPLHVRDLGDGYFKLLAPAATPPNTLTAAVYTPPSAAGQDTGRPTRDLGATAGGRAALSPSSSPSLTAVDLVAESETQDREDPNIDDPDSDLNPLYRTPRDVVNRLSRKADDVQEDLIAIGRKLGNAHQALDEVKQEIRVLRRMMGV